MQPTDTLVGKAVVDAEGVELGYVSEVSDTFLRIAEGPVGSLYLGRRFVDRIADRIVLRGSVFEMLNGMNASDSQGEFVGVIRDTVETDGVLDSVVVEDEEGEMVVVLLEDIRSIDQWIELEVTVDELYER